MLRPISGLLAVTLGGCSFALAKPPPDPPRPSEPVRCQTTRGYPAADIALGVVGLGAGLFFGALEANAESDPEIEGNGLGSELIIAGAFVWALVFSGSAVYGFRSAADCRTALSTPVPP